MRENGREGRRRTMAVGRRVVIKYVRIGGENTGIRGGGREVEQFSGSGGGGGNGGGGSTARWRYGTKAAVSAAGTAAARVGAAAVAAAEAAVGLLP